MASPLKTHFTIALASFLIGSSATAQPASPPGPQEQTKKETPAPAAGGSASPQASSPSRSQASSAQAPTTSQAASPQAPAPPTAAPSGEASATSTEPKIPANLTQSAPAPDTQAQTPARSTVPSEPQDPSVSMAELRRRHTSSAYRPAHDPVRFQGTFRGGLFAGGRTATMDGGRGMGIELEPGLTRNMFGVSLALGAQFGRFNLVPLDGLPHHPEVSVMARPKHPGYKTPVSFSAGLRAGIGRLALQGTGFIDPRLGYLMNWTAVQRLSGHRPKKIAVTHGPSLRIDAGFLSMAPGRQREFRRVFGATLGWDMRMGGVNTPVPTGHFIFIGVFAQMN